MSLLKDLLFRTFEILKPRLIIALTSYRLDRYLLNNALNLVGIEYMINPIDDNGIINEYMLGEIVIENSENPLCKTKIIRAYHPSYFMGKINKKDTHIEVLKQLVLQGINSSKSKYYIDTLMNNLKKYSVSNPLSYSHDSN